MATPPATPPELFTASKLVTFVMAEQRAGHGTSVQELCEYETAYQVDVESVTFNSNSENAKVARKGYLLKKGAKGPVKAYKLRYFVLRGNRIFYYKDDQANSHINFIELDETTRTSKVINPSKPTAQSKFKFRITSTLNTTRNYKLYTTSEEDREGWMQAIDAAVVRQIISKSKKESLRTKKLEALRSTSLESISRKKQVIFDLVIDDAEGLPFLDSDGTNSPYCILKIENSATRTSKKKRNKAPIVGWGEDFSFVVRDPWRAALEVYVVHHAKPHTALLGKLSLPLGPLMEQRDWSIHTAVVPLVSAYPGSDPLLRIRYQLLGEGDEAIVVHSNNAATFDAELTPGSPGTQRRRSSDGPRQFLLAHLGPPCPALYARVDTGDIVLFSNRTDALTHLTKVFTLSTWDHVGMVVRDTDGELRLLEATLSGVTLDSLQVSVVAYQKTSVVGFRRLRVPLRRRRQLLAPLYEFVQHVLGRPYERDWLEMAKSIVPGKNQEDLTSLFCSELVAAAYQKVGLLSAEKKSSNNFTPGAFGKQLELLDGASLSVVCLVRCVDIEHMLHAMKSGWARSGHALALIGKALSSSSLPTADVL